ncbi:MAG: hypothetical protein M4579_006393 [Chaenotheca gracillima]|nr:MAG: hypothetical protein M4579_006393 [Chaenotheca gracillima]
MAAAHDATADLDLQGIHDFLISIAHKAGDMIRAAHPTSATSGSKKNSADLVTETDQAVEKMVSTSLREKYPDFLFMGEETYQPGDRLTRTPTFVVDPIDGTTNFVHSHSYVSISLALCVDLIPVIGVVYNPFLDTLYTGIKGRGSYLNLKTPLPLKDPPEPLGGLKNALVAVEWGSDRSGPNWDAKWKTFRNLGASPELGGGMVHSLRSLGSAALNFCGVARGDLDVYWEAGCWAWDVAAGWVILTEAGGLVADANPGGWDIAVDARRYIAVRGTGKGGKGQKEMIEEFWGKVEGKFDYEQ